MAAIRPIALPPIATVNPTGAIVLDDGAVVGRINPPQLVDSVAPVVSQADAIAGTDNTARMTALRTAQVVNPLVAAKLNRAGDTMTGPLVLAGPPTVDLGAATKKYVDDGLAGKASSAVVTTFTNGIMLATDKVKLDGIEAGAQVNTVNSVNSQTGAVIITAADIGAATTAVVTASDNGLMIAADKVKLDTIAAGAQVNTVNSVAGRTGTVVLTKADVGLGNVDNTSDANKPISTATATALSGKASTDAVTTTVNGLMIAADKVKLNGIAAGAQVNTVNSVAGKTGAVTLVKGDVGLGNVDNTSDANKPISTATATALAGKASTAAVTTTANGLMIAADKVKLNGIGTGARVVSVSGGTGITIDNTDPQNPIVISTGGGGGGGVVNSVVAGTGIAVNNADPTNPVVSSTVTKADIGLGNVDNTSDANKPVSTAQNTAITARVAKAGDTMTGLLTLSGAPTANLHAATKLYVDTGLSGKAANSVVTTTVNGLMIAADKVKLDGIAAGAQVNAVTSVAGKTGVVTLVKGDVGLGNVDNTSDANKPVSTATATALAGKASTDAVTTTVNGLMIAADKVKLDGIAAGAQVNAVTSVAGRTGAVVLTKADVGLGNVDNTSDVNKPVSTDTATALAGKLSNTGGTFTSGYRNTAPTTLGTGSVTASNISPTINNFFTKANTAPFTLNAPTASGAYSLAILVTNAASGSGAMTTVGFSKVHGAFATTADKAQLLLINVIGSNFVLTIMDAN